MRKGNKKKNLLNWV